MMSRVMKSSRLDMLGTKASLSAISVKEGALLTIWSLIPVSCFIDEGMKKKNENEKQQSTWKFRYSQTIGLLCDYIVKAIEHRKPSATNMNLPPTLAMDKAMNAYHQFFRPGELSFCVPPDTTHSNSLPGSYYSSIEGKSVYYVDWKLAFPNLPLPCPLCKSNDAGPTLGPTLVHDRTNFSKNRLLFPLWNKSGLPSWCIVMHYKCEKCQSRFQGNDGRILANLPEYASGSYPVLPRYASGTFHLHQDLTDDLESVMRTYGNAKMFSESMYKKIGTHYTRRVQAYLSKNPSLPFLSFQDFSSGITPPTDTSIRQAFTEGEYSPLTPYGYSPFSRYEREMQGVKVEEGENIAFDWTFQAIKNYNLPGAKAIFTGNKGSTKEIITLAIVKSTATKEVAHLLTQSLQKRSVFKPTVLYTDTCPNGDSFWRAIFGISLATKLGLFHLLHQIFDTLDPKCEAYWKGLIKLKNCVYTYHESDESALIASLKDGSFSQRGEKLSDLEIRDLRHSSRWKQRYSAYLRKKILPGETICHRLKLWLEEFKETRDQAGKLLFTRHTEKVTSQEGPSCLRPS